MTGDWDLTAFFEDIESEDYRTFARQLTERTSSLASDWSQVDSIEQSLLSLQEVTQDMWHLDIYLSCRSAADANDELAAVELAKLAEIKATIEAKQGTAEAYLASLSEEKFEELASRPSLQQVSYALRRLRDKATFRMTDAEEELAAQLGVTGLHAWGRLYNKVQGELTFTLETEGQREVLPVGKAHSLLQSSSREIREATFRGQNAAWDSVSTTTCACLNNIAGTRLALYERRGIDDFLRPALFDAAISKQTLETMLAVTRKNQPTVWSYLDAKAKALGIEQLTFADQFAPVGKASDLSWQSCNDIILSAFKEFSPALHQFSEMAFEKKWIDYSARDGKRPGGFCAPSARIGESRIFVNFNGSLGDLLVVAHELGHAFHSWEMRDLPLWAQEYPMTLAETASTFAEAVVSSHLLSSSELTRDERLYLLGTNLDRAVAFLCNILARFDFEKKFYSERAAGEVPKARANELMIEAQIANFGDRLDRGNLAPLFWASKLHFYITEISFYNFPYTFGYLLSQGLFAMAKKEGSDFLEKYSHFLRYTAGAQAEAVAKETAGIDLNDESFWQSSIDLVADDLAQFLALL